MDNTCIFSPEAPAAVGPYAHAVLAGNTLYLSGQLGLNPATGELPEGVEAQAEQALRNIGAVLAAAGFSYDDVVKTSVFLQDLADFGRVNEIYARYFPSKPARSCMQVAKLPKGGLCEVEAIAVKA